MSTEELLGVWGKTLIIPQVTEVLYVKYESREKKNVLSFLLWWTHRHFYFPLRDSFGRLGFSFAHRGRERQGCAISFGWGQL